MQTFYSARLRPWLGKHRRTVIAVWAVLLTPLLVYALAFAVSPAYYQAGGLTVDANYYKVAGLRMVQQGAVPYVDFADNKGPYWFWYQGFCAWLDPQWGVYIGQILLLIPVFFCLWDLGDDLGLHGWEEFAWILVTLCLVYGGMEGDLVDDTFLVLLFVPLWLFVKSVRRESAVLTAAAALAAGLALGILLFTRANNAVLPGCLGVALAVNAIRRGQRGQLVGIVSTGLLAAGLAVAVPLLVYNANGHLAAMLQWTFGNNFTYVAKTGLGPERIAMLVLTPLFGLAAGWALLRYRRFLPAETVFFAGFYLLLQSFVTMLTFQFFHHMKMALPAYLLPAAAWLLHRAEVWAGPRAKARATSYLAFRLTAVGLVAALPVYATVMLSLYYYSDYNYGYRETLAQQDTMAQIPPADRASGKVIAVDMGSRLYLNGPALPDFAFYDYQTWNSTMDPSIKAQLLDYIADQALWVFVNDRPYVHPDLVPIYRQDDFKAVLAAAFTPSGLSRPGKYLVYQRNR